MFNIIDLFMLIFILFALGNWFMPRRPDLLPTDEWLCHQHSGQDNTDSHSGGVFLPQGSLKSHKLPDPVCGGSCDGLLVFAISIWLHSDQVWSYEKFRKNMCRFFMCRFLYVNAWRNIGNSNDIFFRAFIFLTNTLLVICKCWDNVHTYSSQSSL